MKPVTDPETLAALGHGGLRSVRDPAVLAQLNYGIDVNADKTAIRKRINELPETEKAKAYDIWADHKVAQMRSKGFDQMPDAARGIPIIGPYLDEATAGINSALSSLTDDRIGAPYAEALADERARVRAAEAAHPAAAAASQLAAGITTGGPILSRLAPAATLAGRMGQGAVVGGGVGAIDGFGHGEGGVTERANAAMDGLQGGATVGVVLPVAGAAITRGVGAVSNLVAPTYLRLRHGPDAAANRILADRIANEGSTPAAKRLDLQQGQAQDARLGSNSEAHLPETIADTSDAMQRLTGSLYRSGGEAGNFIRSQLQGRQRGVANKFVPRNPSAPPDGQAQRILDNTERALLIRTANTARQTDRQIMAQQARDGNRLYEQARNSNEVFDIQPAIMGMALRAQDYGGAFRTKLNNAIALFRDDFPQRRAVNTIRRFDSAKKALDDEIETAQRAGQGNLVRELTRFKNELLDRVHMPDAAGRPTLNAAYHEARATWGSAAENREAIELGRAALREGSEVSVEQFRELTAGQQTLFRIGYMESLRNALGSKRPGNDVTQLFQQRRVQELMQEIIPRPKSTNAVFSNRPERFGNIMQREERMASTNQAVLGNSATAQRHQDDIGFAGDALAGMWNRFRSSPSLINIGIEAVGVGIQRYFGYRQDVALALARRLLEANPQARNQILRRLQGRGGRDRMERFAAELDRATPSAAAAIAGPLSQGAGGEAR